MPRLLPMRTASAASALVAASLLAVTACGSATSASSRTTLAPADAIRAGFDGLQAANALTYTIKLDITQQQITALETANTGKTGTESLKQAAVLEKALVGGSLVFAQKAAGKSFAADQSNPSAPSKEGFAVSVNAGDQRDLVQLVFLDEVLYGRANIAKIADYGGARSESALKKLGSGEATTYPFLATAAAGGWLEFSVASALSFLQGVAPGAVPMVGPSQITGLTSSLAKVFTTDVKSSRSGQDPALGDHIVLTGNSKTIGTDLVSAFRSSLGSLPGASSVFGMANTSSLPSKSVTVDTYIKDGALDAVKFNITQFLDAKTAAAVGASPIAVEIDIARTASISAPSNPTSISTAQLLGLFAAIGARSLPFASATASAPVSAGTSSGY